VVPPVVEPPVVVPPEEPPVVPPEEEPPIVVVPPIPPVVPEEPPGTPFFRPPVLPSITPPPLAKGGLNPGYITDVPDFYNTTNSAQSKFYWGRHAYQPGPTFDRQLYNTAPNAPAQPFGIQNMSTNTLNYNQLMALAQGQQLQPPATTQPASPVNPTYNQYNSTVPFTQPIVPQMVGTVPYKPMLSYEEYIKSLTDPNYVANPVAP
jgi:histone-lysine N-methyltransferase MLL2